MSLMRRSVQSGFTMIEVLISLVVLSIGLLGLAGLQNMALKFDHEAYVRSQAAFLVSDMAARMSANRNAAASYDGNSGATLPAACETSAGCTATELADYDSARWQASVAALLPQGSGSVALVGTGPLHLITVNWHERGDDQTHSFTMEVYP